ncbi:MULTISPECIES: hypothetical protein [unclassified Undibacterium]|uniref:hypothetical protein n=1 Tax=unclassified Undibacterium TaxID=2630295 RepID=UPI002AC9476B|nr:MULTISPECIES: hypothetical protein [unclassified Undibacterium]MEB0140893.1 hypothetical protein [Undibacterium sp. CCC2.1]MEB0173862.1 hypothetical protein [Undibacterium sp. CCC1.1]MEB0177852.1 hypothetical protein [Undibacterium sp. CCC3.4]MEB0217073.1 hypothetical protein [Undibacterium sp. 5I2]WPX45500.1 hypothetical protein RHM61_09900 [Undibacterium sp. CCC3.4]
MQNFSDDSPVQTEDDLALQTYFKSGISPDDVAAVFPLRRGQPVIQAFTALFHGGFNGVLLRLLVLRELSADVDSPSLSRADINAKLGYLEPEALETALARLRSTGLLIWDASQAVYRIAPTARNVLAALASLLQAEDQHDPAEMSYMLTQVAGAQAVGGVSVEQLHHLLGRLIELTEEFSDAIASGSEFQLRSAQKKWHTACDWVEKGSQIILAITHDSRADSATHRAAQAIGRAQSALLNMQGMFSRALNQIERQRVHLGQSGLSTTDIKTWLLQKEDLASLADEALASPVTPLFITPSEMVDVAESELLSQRVSAVAGALPVGENAISVANEDSDALHELDHWLALLTASAASAQPLALQDILLPANFSIASYRASMLPLLGDINESALQGATALLARLPLTFNSKDKMHKLHDSEVAAMSVASLIRTPLPPDGTPHD